MSEYQYYEFQAVDRPLTDREMRTLRSLSTRADITPTRFVNEYHWSDFKGDPRKLMQKYFDAFVYYANWGTHWHMLRVPRETMSLKAAKAYSVPGALTVKSDPNYLLFDFYSEDEPGDWKGEMENWMASLLPLRMELVAGDLRCLYLGWLAGIQRSDVDEERLEPPVPSGLKTLSPAQRELSDFLRIDVDLLAVAARASLPHSVSPPGRTQLETWVAALPAKEKDSLLVDIAAGDSPFAALELQRRFRKHVAKTRPTNTKHNAKPRSVGDLVRAAEERGHRQRSNAK